MKSIRKVFLLLAIVSAMIAIGLSTEIPSYLKYKNGDITDYSEIKSGQIAGDELVTGIIDDCDGSIAELEETNTIFGIPTSKRVTSQFYAVYTYNDEYIIYETADKDEISTLNQLEEQTAAFYQAVSDAYENASEDEEVDLSDVEQPTATLEFTGRITTMRSDLRDIFKEWYGEGFEQDCETTYIIRKCNFSSFKLVIPGIIASGIFAVLMLVLTILSFIKSRRARQFSY